jgi:hypothetical protein
VIVTYSTHEEDEKYIENIRNLKGRDYLEVLSCPVRKPRWDYIVKVDLKIGSKDVNWINLVHDRVQWRAV